MPFGCRERIPPRRRRRHRRNYQLQRYRLRPRSGSVAGVGVFLNMTGPPADTRIDQRKGKPAATQGRKARGPLERVAQLPNGGATSGEAANGRMCGSFPSGQHLLSATCRVCGLCPRGFGSGVACRTGESSEVVARHPQIAPGATGLLAGEGACEPHEPEKPRLPGSPVASPPLGVAPGDRKSERRSGDVDRCRSPRAAPLGDVQEEPSQRKGVATGKRDEPR